MERLLERLWYASDPAAVIARAVLAPASAAFATVTAARNALYDVGLLRTIAPVLPTIAVGNLTVGGTGKTPVAAWIASRLLGEGARPAIVLRGYGGDEPLVHAELTPGAIVVTGSDRIAAIARASALGADVAVLDDAFQHRRAGRVVDVVLVAAERWGASARVLPTGPYRESRRALRRAALVVTTRKSASAANAAAVAAAVRREAPGVPTALVHLAPAGLSQMGHAEVVPLAHLAGRPVLAVCGIAEPEAFRAQLAAVGARVTLRSFGDHHDFGAEVVGQLVREAEAMGRAGDGLVVCTLKDAVKLRRSWPADAPALWHLTQHVILEAGHDPLDRLLKTLLRARPTAARSPR